MIQDYDAGSVLMMCFGEELPLAWYLDRCVYTYIYISVCVYIYTHLIVAPRIVPRQVCVYLADVSLTSRWYLADSSCAGIRLYSTCASSATARTTQTYTTIIITTTMIITN